MKVDTGLIRKALQEAMDESLREVNSEILLADVNDKFYNFGVSHMFYATLAKLDEIEKIAREVSA